MDPRSDPAGNHGHGHVTEESTPPLRRRLSMDEDLYYQRIMSSSPRQPSQPPPYQAGPYVPVDDMLMHAANAKGKSLAPDMDACAIVDEDEEKLPGYSNSVHMEGIFCKKHEIESTTKRAEDRRWHNMFVSLNGTALSIYHVKKDWGWGKTRDGPSICPDNPPWMRKAKLEKTYSLLHADAGIAADYKKRRYVIRIRAESDQFLLACIELSTFVKWLEALFAAIDIAAPIDERDFPRDMSIPRVQRIRWFRGQSPVRLPQSSPTRQGSVGEPSSAAEERRQSSSSAQRRPSTASATPLTAAGTLASEAAAIANFPTHEVETVEQPDEDTEFEDSEDEDEGNPRGRRLAHRLSTTSYHNASVDPFSGKWFPEHKWSEAHDMLYAKLCYSNLLFRSPRKSHYIIDKGKQWFVDWTTGRMVRVLPPGYNDEHLFGPWQVIHTENSHI